MILYQSPIPELSEPRFESIPLSGGRSSADPCFPGWLFANRSDGSFGSLLSSSKWLEPLLNPALVTSSNRHRLLSPRRHQFLIPWSCKSISFLYHNRVFLPQFIEITGINTDKEIRVGESPDSVFPFFNIHCKQSKNPCRDLIQLSDSHACLIRPIMKLVSGMWGKPRSFGAF